MVLGESGLLGRLVKQKGSNSKPALKVGPGHQELPWLMPVLTNLLLIFWSGDRSSGRSEPADLPDFAEFPPLAS
jgi:hypothetical protein